MVAVVSVFYCEDPASVSYFFDADTMTVLPVDDPLVEAFVGGGGTIQPYVPPPDLPPVDPPAAMLPMAFAASADLRAADTTMCNLAVLNDELWVWKAGNYSAKVAADTNEISYIKSTATAASAGCWVRISIGGRTAKTFENNVNTLLQIANPGIGATAGQYGKAENVAYFDPDGGLFIGPGARPDITLYCNSFFNLFRIHEHIRFNQPAFSGSRPEIRLGWTGVGSGSFQIAKTTYGGALQISTGATAGGGGVVRMDYMTMNLAPGQATAWVFYLDNNGNVLIELGWETNSANKVTLLRSEVGVGDQAWIGRSIQGGTEFATTTASKTGTQRRVLILYYRANVGIEVYIGNTNNTIVPAYTIPISQLPNAGELYTPYLKFTSQGANVNRSLYMTNFYASLVA